MLSSDFFRGTDGFFRRSARLFTKKVLFRPKTHKGTFSAVTINLETFSTLTVEISVADMGIFGRFVFIPFYSYERNRATPTTFPLHCVTTATAVAKSIDLYGRRFTWPTNECCEGATLLRTAVTVLC